MEKEIDKQTQELPEPDFEEIPFLSNLMEKVTRKYNYIIMLPIYILLIILLLNVVQLCLVCKILLNYKIKM